MKNDVLLCFVAMCGAAFLASPSDAMAWDDPVLEFVTPDLSTDGTGGGAYYIYHPGTQKFMTNGNAWNTQLSVGDEGQEITLYYGTDRGLIREDTAYTYRGWVLNMLDAPSNSGFHEVFMESTHVAYVDCNLQGHMLWRILPQEDGAYWIKVIDEDPVYGENSGNQEVVGGYMGVNGEESTIVLPCVNPGTAGYEGLSIDWKFVASKDYEVYRAKKALKVQLEEADAVGFTDYASYQTLYESHDVSPAAVEQAVQDLADDISGFKYAVASEQNPMDVTHLIYNPSFNGNADGWTTSRDPVEGRDNFQYQGASQPSSDGTPFVGFFERWIPSGNQPDWSITQELHGIPDGKYRLTAYILTNVMADAEAGVSGPEGRFLVAKSLGEEVRVEADVPSPYGAAYAAPYSLEFSVAGGEATIGMRVIDANSNWSGVDNFSLEYLGNGGDVEGIREMLQERAMEAQAELEAYEAENRAFSQNLKLEIVRAIDALQGAVADLSIPEDSLLAAFHGLNDAMGKLEGDMEVYERLWQFAYDEANAYWNPPYENLDLVGLDDFISELMDSYDDRTFDPADIDSVRIWADRIFREEVMKALENGETDEFAGLLGNHDCSDDANVGGWQGANVLVLDGVCEVYNTPTDIYQVLTGLPEGSYEVSANALYRPADNATCMNAYGLEGDGTNDVLSYLYGNDALKKLQHVYTHVFDEPQTGSGMVYVQLDTPNMPEYVGKWAVDSRASAAAAFADGLFRDTLVCYVNADGVLRVGVKMPVNSALFGYWTCFDNFSIKYLGADDLSGLASMVETYISQAEGVWNDGRLATAEAEAGLAKAITDAVESISNVSALEKEACMVAAENLQEAIGAYDASCRLVLSLDSLLSCHEGGLTSGAYDQYGGMDEYGELEELVVGALNLLDMDVPPVADEVRRYIAEISLAYGRMVQNAMDVSFASVETPVEVTGLLGNPDFQKQDEDGEYVSSNDGWNIVFNGGTTLANELVYEFYNNASFDISQTLYGLNPGYYRLDYNGYYRAGDMFLAALAHRDGTEALNAEAYVRTESTVFAKPLMSICEVEKPDKYEAADFVMPDSLFPGSPNNYHCVVNSMLAGHLAFEDGEYEDGFYFQVKEGETVRVGVRKSALIAGDWACFDDFRLHYYGDGEENRPEDMPDAIKSPEDGTASLVDIAWYGLNGMRVDEPSCPGFYIKVERWSDGRRSVTKILIR